jgi:adenosylcobinamide-GDP ribazoletransferase
MSVQSENPSQQMQQEDGPPFPSAWLCFLTAVQFLTRVPVKGAMTGTMEFYEGVLRRSVAYFPLVGGLVGLATACVLALAGHVFPASLAALIAIVFEAALTGAFHEDALADTWDALGGGWTTDQVLEIMKDSRIGTYGALSLMLGVGMRVAAVTALWERSAAMAFLAVVAAATVARWSILLLMVTTPPVESRESLARDVSGMQTARTLGLSALWSLPFWGGWGIVFPIPAMAGMLAVLLMIASYRRKILRRVGGTTGDLLGCGAYLSQLIVLLAAVALPG